MKRLAIIWIDTDDIISDINSGYTVKVDRLNVSNNLTKGLIFWSTKFSKVYKNWLDNDNEGGLFDINSEIHQEGQKLCGKLERELNDTKCYYWFDVNRSLEEYNNFIWKNCPECNERLCSIGKRKFGLICKKCKIVVPKE